MKSIVSVACAAVLCIATVAHAQSPPLGDLSPEQQARFQQLLQVADSAAYIEQVDAFWHEVRKGLDDAANVRVHDAIVARAKEHLTAGNALATAAPAPLALLINWGKQGMTAEEIAAIGSQVGAQRSRAAALDFEQFTAWSKLAMKMSDNSLAAIIDNRQAWIDWLGARDIATVPTDQLVAIFHHTRPVTRLRTDTSVVWTGSVTAPRTGDYVFSISPFDGQHRVSR